MTRAPFGKRLADATRARGTLCVGIDPHPELLRSWGLTADRGGLERFALTVVDAIGDTVAVIKPQSALFEAHGSAGIAVLERVIERARQAGALVLLDVKRGDISSTMAAYASAYLDDASSLAADAITVSPYLGVGSLTPTFSAARAVGRGVIVLARTSNPEGDPVQRAVLADGRTVAQVIVDEVATWNAGAEPIGDIGVVVGATVGQAELNLDELNGPILAPGFGAQGATGADLRRLFGTTLPTVLPTSSRDILRHGPDPAALRAAALRARESVHALLA